MECAASRHVTLCDADSRGFIVVAFCSAILHHWMCKIPTEVATLTRSDMIEAIEEQGHTLEYLPSYSPDLNPIERKWAEAKAIRRKYHCSIEDLFLEHLHYVNL
ncbi:hypothetical protein PsalN5692_03523 [Piscirickettsia salmonis]|nr:hypothetical protein PsalN5692_03523 [Piscirickettsia salmonis]